MDIVVEFVGHGIEPKSAQSPKLSRCSGAMKPAAIFSSTAASSAPPAWAAEPSPLRPKMTLRRGVSVVLGRAQCQTAWSILRAQPPPHSVPQSLMQAQAAQMLPRAGETKSDCGWVRWLVWMRVRT